MTLQDICSILVAFQAAAGLMFVYKLAGAWQEGFRYRAALKSEEAELIHLRLQSEGKYVWPKSWVEFGWFHSLTLWGALFFFLTLAVGVLVYGFIQ